MSRTSAAGGTVVALVGVTLTAAAALFVFAPRSSTPEVSNAGRRAFLAYCDTRFDAEADMVRESFRNPGYHSRVPTGTDVHPTRESLAYAVALFERDELGDAERARAILARVIRLQDADPASPTYGLWPWLEEEPLAAMSDPDRNWADFCGAHLVWVLRFHAERLPAPLRERVTQSLRHAVTAIRERDTNPGYTNIAVLGGSVCAAAGELLDDVELLHYGRRRLRRVVALVREQGGGFTEYNSPPYAQVVITACERTLHTVRDPATRAAAESLRRTTWRMIADHFHPGTGQWSGPHSRTSRDRIRISTVRFLECRTGLDLDVHPTMVDEPSRELEIVTPLPCPAEFVGRFRSAPKSPRTIRRTFVKHATPSRATVGTTWSNAAATLGSVTRSSFWTQRKPLVAYWRTPSDPAVVFRVRCLKNGRDFASMGSRIVQHGPRALVVLQSRRARGDWHRSLDRPADGRFTASDLRLRCELRGEDVNVVWDDDRRCILSAGGQRIVVHTPAGRFDRAPVRWRIGRAEGRVFLDAVCHTGDPRTWSFDEPLDVAVTLGLELLPADAEPNRNPPRWLQASAGVVSVEWDLDDGTRLDIRAPQRE